MKINLNLHSICFSSFLLLSLSNSEEIIELTFDKTFEKCAKETRGASSTDANLVCYHLHKHLIIRKLEILSLRPFIIQYHNLIHRRMAKRAVREANDLELEQLMIDGTSPNSNQKSHLRVANGTGVGHQRLPIFGSIFRNINLNIKALDLNAAEPWQILSYNSNGYYAPHYDYLNADRNRGIVEGMGNRIATVLVILQIARLGGTTVFPKLDLNIRPKIGDVVVWLNMEATGEADMMTLHAACPIRNGTKIAASLWVHSKNQEFSLPCSLDPRDYDTSGFIDF